MFSMEGLLSKIREEKPLVHHITNYVTVADCAAATRNIGALPVMAQAIEEVGEMVQASGALVINIGTLSPSSVESMLEAAKIAKRSKIPVVLDPVGAGATALRTESAQLILEKVLPDIIKGNAAEIAILSGMQGEIKGVESLGGADPSSAAARLAKKCGCLVAVTGKEDNVTDGKQFAVVKNGHSLMGAVVGTGCIATSLIGAFSAVEKDYFKAVTTALAAFGVAGELAAAKLNPEQGPLAYKTLLLDELYFLKEKELVKRAYVDLN